MVDVDCSSLYTGGLTAQVDWLGLRVGSHPALSLHSSSEPALSHDDSTINIVICNPGRDHRPGDQIIQGVVLGRSTRSLLLIIVIFLPQYSIPRE